MCGCQAAARAKSFQRDELRGGVAGRRLCRSDSGNKDELGCTEEIRTLLSHVGGDEAPTGGGKRAQHTGGYLTLLKGRERKVALRIHGAIERADAHGERAQRLLRSRR